MLAKSIKLGDRIRITRIEDDVRGKAYISQVENVENDNVVVVLVPFSYGRLIKLPVGSIYSFLFFTDLGMIRFDASIMEIFVENKIHLMRIKLESEGERMQRRYFYRFSCLLPLKYSIVEVPNEEEANEFDPETMYDGIIKDIGGGGIRFVSNSKIAENSIVKCLILLEENFFIVLSKILSTQHFPKSAYKYQYRAVFVDILPSEQDLIVHYIFAEQRKLLQKSVQ